MRRERGLTLVEAVIASAMFFVLASAGLVGGRAHFHEIGRSYDELAASKAVSSRLEAISADPAAPIVGERPLADLPLGTETVVRREPGLFEVTVRVTDETGRVLAEITTLLAREERR